MNIRKICSLIICVINCLLIIGVIVYLLIINNTNMDGSRIFNMNFNSIIEVKATTENVGESFGTGVIYDSEGYFLTNAHVVSYTSLGETKKFDKFEIRFSTNNEYQDATLIKMDVELDLAILKINDEGIKYNKVDFSKDDYNYGDKVYAIGNTSNYGIGISEGIISVPEVNVTYNNISRLVIQADINICSGNSGGALLDKKGNLIGITTFRTKDLSGNTNYGFTYSIPLKIIKNYVEEG